MDTRFRQTRLSLEHDTSHRDLLILSTTLVFLAIWSTWFTVARVAVYAASGQARLEVESHNHGIDAPIGGRVVVGPGEIGQRVKAGDVLLEVDAVPESLAQNEAESRLRPAATQLSSLRNELAAEQRALGEERRAAQAATTDSDAKVAQARAAAELAAEESKRLLKLQPAGLVSDLDVLRAKNAMEQRQGDVRSAEASARLVVRDLGTREQDRLARIAGLNAQIASLEGVRDQAIAASKRLSYEIDRRQVRAPIGGTLADVASVRVGSVVAAGAHIATIVPDGKVKVVAFFPPSEAIGRVHVGQPGRVRLQGFPWTQYGAPLATVSRVGGEVRDGAIRVELDLADGSVSAVPLQHGLPAEVDIEIERISPAIMVLRAIGRRTGIDAAQLRP